MQNEQYKSKSNNITSQTKNFSKPNSPPKPPSPSDNAMTPVLQNLNSFTSIVLSTIHHQHSVVAAIALSEMAASHELE
jgi:hypothetical protein